MSDKRITLDELARMTADDFRAMNANDLVGLAVQVSKEFDGLQLTQVNPNYSKVLNELDESTRKDTTAKLNVKIDEIDQIVDNTPLGALFAGYIIKSYKDENGKSVREIKYLTATPKKREKVATPTAQSKPVRLS